MTDSRTILVDLRAAQFNGDRGIPAYAQSLTAELVRRPTGHRWLLLHDPARPLPGRADELASHAEWRSAADLERDRSLRIDAVLTGCYFLPDHRCGVDYLRPAWLARHEPRWTGIVYDLVPLLFPDRYLHRPRARSHYLDCLRLLRKADRLFAISHATRRDAIRHAAVDPVRIECIYGDIDHRKRLLMAQPATASGSVPARYGLRSPYCVCIGGDDWRKNMPTVIRGFAAFHADHPEHQLAIVCKFSADRIADLRRLAAEAGLPADAVVCTGFVSDEDLVGLVRHARLLVYPSLYEGLGLPVLEAHGCGTPVVGSNTSSVAELVHPDLACDPEDPLAIAATMRRVILDPAVADRSREFGRRLLDDDLGWSRAADRVLDALVPRRQPCQPPSSRTRLAVAGVLPPARTGIASYTLRFLQSDRWQTTFYEASPGPRLAQQADLRPDSRLAPIECLPAALLRDRHDTAIFVLGNSSHHAKVLDAIMATRGMSARRLAYLHEASLESLFRGWRARVAAPDQPAARSSRATAPAWIQEALTAKPALGHGLRFLAERAELDGLIVNSAACRDLIQAVLGPLADRWTIDVAFHPVARPVNEQPADPRIIPGSRGPLRIGSFGLAGDTKQLDLVHRAAEEIRRRRPVSLVVAGWEAARYCRRLGHRAGLEVIDAPEDESLTAAMRSVHVAVQLRWPTFGESSGVVSRLLALGTPVVATAAGSFAELPAELARCVPPDCSPEELADAIEAAATARVATHRREELLAPLTPESFAERFADVIGSIRPVLQPISRSA